MATFAGTVGPSPELYDELGAGAWPWTASGSLGNWTVVAGVLAGIDSWLFSTGYTEGAPSIPGVDSSAGALWTAGFGTDWFDQIHIIPSSLALGNVLSTQFRTVDIFNSFLISKSISAFTNNAGQGVSITNLPALPYALNAFSSIVLQIQVSTVGPPTIAGTLDFTTSAGTRSVSLTGRRAILIPVRPNSPIREAIEFMTDVLISRDETEQRIALLDGPRTVIELDFFDSAVEASGLRSLLFDWLPRVWGVPAWWEERNLTANATLGSATVSVNTQFMDLRIGSLAVVYTDQFDFEALEVLSFTSTTVTFTSTLQRNHSASNSSFIPVRICYAEQSPRGGQLVMGQQRLKMEFTTVDTVDLSSSAAFPTFNSKVILSEPNVAPGGGQVAQSWSRKTDRIESPTGKYRILELADRSRIRMLKSFYCASAQRLWEVRQLFHALKGRQVSFYLPTFRDDFTVTQTIAGGGVSLTVRNCGFTDFIRQREPFAALRLVLKDGTTFVKTILASTTVSLQEETITVNSSFSVSPILVTAIDHCSLVVLVRNDDDRLVFEHRFPGYATATMEVVSTKA